MKLASYIAEGKESFGVVVDGGVVTLNEKLGGKYADLKELVAAGAYDEAAKAAEGASPDYDLKDIEYLPLISNPGKIICIGINYKAHAAEHGQADIVKPNIFIKFTDCLAAHEGKMMRPKVSEQFDYEGELALVVGKAGRYVSAEDALSHVAGYTCFCETSVRDFIKESLITGKNFPNCAPLGPWMVTTDEIPDPSKLHLTTRLNGNVMQDSGTDMLMHGVPELIAFITRFTPIAPGDIISTGTPEGIGAKRNPQVWMKEGDVLEVEISQIGTLRGHVVDEA
jgi:2-keto-4-pentenoate hydratase/2-oxohepta-3-ene-1,7-dioic acid hydratase in catechol pathway